MTKFCNQCGSPINEGERFCPKCGAKVSETTNFQNTDTERDRPRITGRLEVSFISKRKLIIMGICIVIVIILALIKG